MKKIFRLMIPALMVCLHSAAFDVKTGNNITISQPVSGNLYVAGGTVTVNAPVHGDLVVSGGEIIINDTVTGDIIVGAGRATINGVVGRSVRYAGGELHINGLVAGDIAGLGGTLEIGKDALVAGGLLAAGGKININGTISDRVSLGVGQVQVNGTLGRDFECHGGDIQINGTVKGSSALAANTITIGNNAAFYGNVRYWNDKTHVDFKGSLKNVQAVYDPALAIESPQLKYLGFVSAIALLWYLGTVYLLALLIWYLLKDILARAGSRQQLVSGRSFGYGLLYAIAVPVVIVLCFITLIGIPVGLILLFAYIVIAVLGHIIASALIAAWIQNNRGIIWSKWMFALITLLIVIAFKLVTTIPFVGWLVSALVVLSSFGAIIRTLISDRARVIQVK